jgi:hypothetical protein
MPSLLPYGVGLFDFLLVYQRRPVRGTPLNHATKRATSRDVALLVLLKTALLLGCALVQGVQRSAVHRARRCRMLCCVIRRGRETRHQSLQRSA